MAVSTLERADEGALLLPTLPHHRLLAIVPNPGAVFYVIKGRGHDIHDGRTIPWKAGDIMIVECGCVHQHFNDDPEEEAILLVFKAKPLFLFMHLLFQKMVTYPPTTLLEGHEDWKPPTDL